MTKPKKKRSERVADWILLIWPCLVLFASLAFAQEFPEEGSAAPEVQEELQEQESAPAPPAAAENQGSEETLPQIPVSSDDPTENQAPATASAEEEVEEVVEETAETEATNAPETISQPVQTQPEDDITDDELKALSNVEEETGSEAPPLPRVETKKTKKAQKKRVSKFKFDPRIPRYQQLKPSWAIQVSGTHRAFDNSFTINGATASREMWGVTVHVEYQPESLQKMGILGFGVSGSAYLDRGTSTVESVPFLQGGGQIRYQGHFFRNQPVVPMAAFSAEYSRFNFSSDFKGKVFTMGPAFGLWFLLNIADPASAADFYVDYGVMRSYLVAEYRMNTGNNDGLGINGNTLFFGLRFEF